MCDRANHKWFSLEKLLKRRCETIGSSLSVLEEGLLVCGGKGPVEVFFAVGGSLVPLAAIFAVSGRSLAVE